MLQSLEIRMPNFAVEKGCMDFIKQLRKYKKLKSLTMTFHKHADKNLEVLYALTQEGSLPSLESLALELKQITLNTYHSSRLRNFLQNKPAFKHLELSIDSSDSNERQICSIIPNKLESLRLRVDSCSFFGDHRLESLHAKLSNMPFLLKFDLHLDSTLRLTNYCFKKIGWALARFLDFNPWIFISKKSQKYLMKV